MTVAEIIEQACKRKLFVNGGPVIDKEGRKREMFWLVTLESIDTPRGVGGTLEEAYADFEEKEEQDRRFGQPHYGHDNG